VSVLLRFGVDRLPDDGESRLLVAHQIQGWRRAGARSGDNRTGMGTSPLWLGENCRQNLDVESCELSSQSTACKSALNRHRHKYVLRNPPTVTKMTQNGCQGSAALSIYLFLLFAAQSVQKGPLAEAVGGSRADCGSLWVTVVIVMIDKWSLCWHGSSLALATVSWNPEQLNAWGFEYNDAWHFRKLRYEEIYFFFPSAAPNSGLRSPREIFCSACKSAVLSALVLSSRLGVWK
jgi:hypothetical protein